MGCAPSRNDRRADGNGFCGRYMYAGLICDTCCGAGGVQGQTPTVYQYGDENSSVPLPDGQGQGQADYSKVHPTTSETKDLLKPTSEHTDVAASASGVDLKQHEDSNVEATDTAPSADPGLEGGVKVKVDTPAGGSVSTETDAAATNAPNMKSGELVSGANAASDARAPSFEAAERVYGHSETMPSSGGSPSATGRPPMQWGTPQRGQDVDTPPIGGAKTTTLGVSGKPPSSGGGSATSPMSGGVQAGDGSTSGMSVVGADTSKPPLIGDLDVPPSASVSAADEQTHLDHDAAPILRLPVSKMAANSSGSRSGTASSSTSGSAAKFTASSPLAARSPAASAYVASLPSSKSSDVEHPRPKRTPRSGKVNSYVQAIETKNPSPAIKREDAVGDWSAYGRTSAGGGGSGGASPAKGLEGSATKGTTPFPGVGVSGAVPGVSVVVEGRSLPKTEGGFDASSVEVCVKVLEAGVSPSGDVKVSVPDDDPKLEGEIPDAGASSVNLPTASVDAPSSDVKPKKRFPNFGPFSFPSSKGKKEEPGFSAPAVEASGSVPADALESNESVSALDVKVSAPDKGVSAPGASVTAPKVDVDVGESAMAPDVSVSAPYVKLSGDVPSAELDASLPYTVPKADVEVKVGGVGSRGDVDAEVPGKLSVEVNKPKITSRITKLMKKPWSKGKVEEPDAPGGDAPAPGVSASAPVKSAPSTDVGATIPAPSLAANVSGMEVPEAPSVGVGSKAPEERSGSESVPKVPEDVPSIGKAEVSAPDVSGSVISVNVSAPDVKIDVCVPSMDADRKAPNVIMSRPDVGVPKPDMSVVPDINESASGVNITAPEVIEEIPPAKTGRSLLSADVPDINESAQGVNITEPEVTDEIPPAKIDNSLPSADLPDINESVSGVNITAPEVTDEIPPAKLGDSLPSADVSDINESASGVNIAAQEVTDEIPSAKRGGSLPSADFGGKDSVVPAGVTMSASAPAEGVSAPSLSAGGKAPNVTLPEPDVGVPAPDVSVSAPDVPDIDESASDVNITTPEVTGEIPSAKSDDSLPAADVKAPESPSAGAGMSEAVLGFIGGLFVSKKADMPGDDVSAPNVDGAKMLETNADVPAPLPTASGEASLPSVDVSAPDMEVVVSAPSVDVGSLKDPEMQAVDVPSVGDKVDSTPDVKIGVSAPSVDTGSLNEPKMPSVSDPSLDAPSVGGKVDVFTPDVKIGVSAPSVDVASLTNPETPLVSGPSVDVTSVGDKVDVFTPDIKVGVSSPSVDVGSLKDPEIPSMDVPSVGDKVDVSTLGVKVVVSAPSMDVGSLTDPEIPSVSGPSVDVPSVGGLADVSIPDVKVAVSAPSVGVPSVGGTADASTPDVKVIVSAPSMDVTSVDGEVDASTPDVKVDVSATSVDVLSVGGKADVSTPDVKVFVSAPSANVCGTVPEVSGEVHAARDAEVSAPPAVTGIEPPDVSTKLPEDSGMSAPEGSISGPEDTILAPSVGVSDTGSEDEGIKAENLDASSVEVKKPKKSILRIFGLVKDKQEAPEIKSSVPEVKMPEVSSDISAPSASDDVSKPSAPGVSVGVPERNVDIPSVKIGVSPSPVKGHAPEGDVSLTAPNVRVDVSVPSVDEGVKVPEMTSAGVPPADLSTVGDDTSVSAPDVSMPSVDVDSKAPDVSVDIRAVGGADVSVDVLAPSVLGKIPETSSVSGPPVDKLSVGGGISVSTPGVLMPSVNISSKVPDVSVDDPVVDGANVSVPHASVEMSRPLESAPEASLAASGVEISRDAKVDASVPSMKGSKATADNVTAGVSAEVGGGKVDVKGSEVPSMDVKPKKGLLSRIFSFGKENDEVPDDDVPEPAVEVNVRAPSASGAKSGPEAPGMPSVSAPSADMPSGVGGDVSVPAPQESAGVSPPASVDVTGKVPEVSVNVSSVGDVGASAPDVSATGTDIGLKAPDVSAPGVDASGPQDLNASADSIAAGASMNTKTDNIEVKTPDLSFDAKKPSIPYYLSRIKWPSARGKIQAPDVNVHERRVEVNVSAPSSTVDVSGTEGSLKGPETLSSGEVVGKMTKVSVTVQSLGGDSGLSAEDLGLTPSIEVSKSSVDNVKKPRRPGLFGIRFPSSKEKMERLSGGAPPLEAPTATEAPAPSADLTDKMPEMPSVTGVPSGSADVSVTAPGVSVDVSAPSDGAASVSERDLEASAPDVKLSGHDVSVSVPKAAASVPEGDASSPGVNPSARGVKVSVDVLSTRADASLPSVEDLRGGVEDAAADGSAKDGADEVDIKAVLSDAPTEATRKEKKGIRLGNVFTSVVEASAPEASVSEDVPSSMEDSSLPSAEGHKTDEQNAATRSGPKIGGDADVPEDPPAVLDEKAPKKSGVMSSFLNLLKPKTELPKADTGSPNVGAEVPDASVDAPSLSVKVPEQGFREDVSGVDVAGKLPDAPMTVGSVSAPGMPSVSLSVSTSLPEVAADVPPLAGKLPGASDVEGSTSAPSAPSVELGGKLPDPPAAGDDVPSVDAPEVDAAGKPLGASAVDRPTADVLVKLPSVEATVKLPEVPGAEGSAKDPDMPSVDAPAANVTGRPPQAPSIKVDVKAPNMKSADVTSNLPGVPPEDAERSKSTPEVHSGVGISVDVPSSEGPLKMTVPADCVEGKDVEVGEKMPSASIVAAGVFDSASGSDFHGGEANVPEPGVTDTAPNVSVNLPDAESEAEARPTKLPVASASLGAAALLQTPGSKGRRTAARLREKFVRLLPGKKPSASAFEEIDPSPAKVGLDEGDKKDLAFDLQVAVEDVTDAVNDTAANLSEKGIGPSDDKPLEVSTKAEGESVVAGATEHSPMAVAKPVTLGGRRSGGRRLFSKYLGLKDKADASDVIKPDASVSAPDASVSASNAKMSGPTVEVLVAKNVADESASLKISPASKPDTDSEDAKSAGLDSSRLSAAFDAAIGAVDDEDTGGATTEGDLVPPAAEPEASPDGDSDLSQNLAAALNAAGVPVDVGQADDEGTGIDVEAPVDHGSVTGGVMGFLFGGGEARHQEGNSEDEQVPTEETPAASEPSTPAAKSGSDVTRPLEESSAVLSRDKVANEAAAESTSEQSEQDKEKDKNDGGFFGMIAEKLGLMPSDEEEDETAAAAAAGDPNAGPTEETPAVAVASEDSTTVALPDSDVTSGLKESSAGLSGDNDTLTSKLFGSSPKDKMANEAAAGSTSEQSEQDKDNDKNDGGFSSMVAEKMSLVPSEEEGDETAAAAADTDAGATT